MSQGGNAFESRSPIDDQVVWSGEETSSESVRLVMEQSAAAGKAWRETTLQERMKWIRAYSHYIAQNRDEIESLISREVGKLPWDAAAEVGAAIAKAEVSIKAFESRHSSHIVDPGSPKRVVRFLPLGVTLVLGPFNFPLHLPGGQIIPAMLAGNTVVMKPSEEATAIGEWIENAWKNVGLPEHVFQLIYGRIQPATDAIDSPHLSGVFLTGGRLAGQAIHRQLAGRYEIQLALELGGNNPMVVLDDVDVHDAANVIGFSSFISAGQRCTCARRAIIMESGNASGIIDELIRQTSELRVGLPGDHPAPHIGPLISADAATSLRSTYHRLVELGCQPLRPMHVDERRPNLIHPCILDGSGLNQSALEELGQLEWFGPMLVVQRASSKEKAFELAAQTSYGLAASLIGGEQGDFDRFVQQVRAGVVNWNRPTTGAAGTMPFGGLGASGNHRPAGYYAIDFCGDPIASLESDSLDSQDLWDVAK